MKLFVALALFALLCAPAEAYLYRLAWDHPGGAVSFLIYRDGALLSETVETVFIDVQITQNAEYVYTVTAVGPSGESAPSDPLVVYTGARGDADGDGVVTALDCAALAQYLAGNVGTCTRRADIDDDFVHDATDLSTLGAMIINPWP